jgi:hypothetical protein
MRRLDVGATAKFGMNLLQVETSISRCKGAAWNIENDERYLKSFFDLIHALLGWLLATS